MRGGLRGLALGAGVAAALACGGLPASGEGTDRREVADAEDPGAAPVPAPADAPAPAPVGPPESLFEPLDAAEAPPTGSPACPEGTSIIRHPQARGLAVYCADGGGRKQGPLQLTKGSRVIELTDYTDGKKNGRHVRWSDANPPVKLAESRWASDVQDGDAAEWDEAGHLVLRGKYAAGAKHGKFIESTAVPGATPTFGGKCHDGGTEAWTTTDPAEFVTRSCP